MFGVSLHKKLSEKMKIMLNTDDQLLFLQQLTSTSCSAVCQLQHFGKAPPPPPRWDRVVCFRPSAAKASIAVLLATARRGVKNPARSSTQFVLVCVFCLHVRPDCALQYFPWTVSVCDFLFPFFSLLTTHQTGGGFAEMISQPQYQQQVVAAYLKSGVEFPHPSAFNSSNRMYPDIR
jgi:hypothetical protein